MRWSVSFLFLNFGALTMELTLSRYFGFMAVAAMFIP